MKSRPAGASRDPLVPMPATALFAAAARFACHVHAEARLAEVSLCVNRIDLHDGQSKPEKGAGSRRAAGVMEPSTTSLAVM
jgi:hypothetical protein